VVKLEHPDLMKKVVDFGDVGNFSEMSSEYLDRYGRPQPCYLLGKRECRILAATESKTITVLLIDYLEQLELIFEKAKEAKVSVFDNKLSKSGVTWREACKAAGIQHPDLTMQYMVKRGVFTKTWCHHHQAFYWKVTPKFIKAGLFKYVQTQGRNSEGFRVLTKGYDNLREQADAINWKCLKFSGHPKHKALYEKHFAEYAKAHPEEFDDFGVWLKPQW
jgi:hypothetical protein